MVEPDRKLPHAHPSMEETCLEHDQNTPRAQLKKTKSTAEVYLEHSLNIPPARSKQTSKLTPRTVEQG